MMQPFRFNPRLQRLRERILHDPYYRFQSGEEIAIASQLGISIDVNHATVDDWLRLPGLSIHQSRTLVQLSQAGVKFYSIEDIAAALSLPVTRLQPLQPILNFAYYDDESIDTPVVIVNPNTASLEILLRVPFIDVDLAKAIIQTRENHGFYTSIVDFQKKLNLAGDVLAQLMYYLRF